VRDESRAAIGQTESKELGKRKTHRSVKSSRKTEFDSVPHKASQSDTMDSNKSGKVGLRNEEETFGGARRKRGNAEGRMRRDVDGGSKKSFGPRVVARESFAHLKMYHTNMWARGRRRMG